MSQVKDFMNNGPALMGAGGNDMSSLEPNSGGDEDGYTPAIEAVPPRGADPATSQTAIHLFEVGGAVVPSGGELWATDGGTRDGMGPPPVDR